jgi:transposase
MIHLPASVRVYLCLNPCDMRRSFDGLHALVRDHLKLDAFAGHLYLFANRRKDRLKLLYWDRDGFAIWAKRLEEGRYVIPSSEAGSAQVQITSEELGALLSGIDLSSALRRKRYRRAETVKKHSHIDMFLLGKGPVSG